MLLSDMLTCCVSIFLYFFFFNDTATTEIYTLSLHDALPISPRLAVPRLPQTSASAPAPRPPSSTASRSWRASTRRSEEHTSELQSRQYLVCRLLLEKKKNNTDETDITGG